MKPLHLDPDLSPVQRAYVLGVEPMKFGIRAHLASWAILLLNVAAAIGSLGTVFAPQSTPAWAFNVARFVAWLMVASAFFVCVINVVGCLIRMLGITVLEESTGRKRTDEEEKQLAAFRKALNATIGANRRYGAYAMFSRWVSRIAMVCILVGLIMNGYVLLPIALLLGWAAAWISGYFERAALVKGIQFLLPEPGPEAASGEDVEPQVVTNGHVRRDGAEVGR